MLLLPILIKPLDFLHCGKDRSQYLLLESFFHALSPLISHVFPLLYWPKAHQESGNEVPRLQQGLIVKHHRLTVDIQTAGENRFRILLLRAVPGLQMVFAAGGQLAYGAVYGICFGSKFPVHHPKPQH